MSLVLAFLLLQNIAISGTLKNADGKSLAGVRVAAMPVGGDSVLGTTYTDKDFCLGLNATQTTLAAIAGLTGATVKK